MSPASRGIDVEKDEKDNDPGIPIPSHAPQNWGHQQGRLVRERGVRYAPPKKDSKMHTTCRSCMKFVCKCARSPTALPVVTCVTRRIVGQFDLEDAACLHKAGAAGGLKKVNAAPTVTGVSNVSLYLREKRALNAPYLQNICLQPSPKHLKKRTQFVTMKFTINRIDFINPTMGKFIVASTPVQKTNQNSKKYK